MGQTWTRTRAELLSEAQTQLKFLRQECLLYDGGDPDYAKQLAVKLRVLLHSTRSSHSVLEQLTGQFCFSCPDFPDLSTVRGDLPHQGQTTFVRCSLSQYRLDHFPGSPPVLTPQPIPMEEGKRYPLRAFRTWWERQVVLLVENRHSLSRKDIVTFLADKDGGAHVDPDWNDALALLNRGLAQPLRMMIALPGGGAKEYTASVDQVLSAATRTIATETLYLFETSILPYCQKNSVLSPPTTP